jgi:hypothetical protein
MRLKLISVKTSKTFKLQEYPVLQTDSNRLNSEKEEVTLQELQIIFSRFLKKRESSRKNINVIDSFSVLFNEDDYTRWHDLNGKAQKRLVEKTLVIPEPDGKLDSFNQHTSQLTQLAPEYRGIIRSFLRHTIQNAFDGFSAAAFNETTPDSGHNRYAQVYPGASVVLFEQQNQDNIFIALINNGSGKKLNKPKKPGTTSSMMSPLWKLTHTLKPTTITETKAPYFLGGRRIALTEPVLKPVKLYYSRHAEEGVVAVLKLTPKLLKKID